MFARLGAKAVFLTMGLALVFAGVLMLPLALAAALAPYVGQAWAYAVTGAILLVPPLLWATIVSLSRPAPPPQPTGMLGLALGVLGRSAPWGAILSGAISGAVQAYLSRNDRRR